MAQIHKERKLNVKIDLVLITLLIVGICGLYLANPGGTISVKNNPTIFTIILPKGN